MGSENPCVLLQATPEDTARFMRFVEKLPCGCWFWNGARSRGRGNSRWYGSFGLKVEGKWKMVRAHRFSCDVLAEPPKPCPPGFDRDHTCQFSLCVNPAHLDIVPKVHNGRLRWDGRRDPDEADFWRTMGQALGIPLEELA